MADDDGTGTPPADPPHPTIDKGTVLAWIREVLDEDAPGAGVDPEEDVKDKARYTVAEAEEIAERAVRRAMKVLSDAKPKRTTPRVKASDDGEGEGSGDGSARGKPEPTPTPPPVKGSDLQARLRKFLVGAD
jgi:hypothetical protein